MLEGYLELTLTSLLNITNVSYFKIKYLAFLGDINRLNVFCFFNNDTHCNTNIPFYHLDNSLEKYSNLTRREID